MRLTSVVVANKRPLTRFSASSAERLHVTGFGM
jgi:hypothetical protein